MFSPKKTAPVTREYWESVNAVAQRIDAADRIVLGVGSGLSAAGGLDYGSYALAQQWFPEYVAAGYKSIVQIMSLFWWQSHCKPESYWGYWSRHIRQIRYHSPVTQPYLDLMELVKDKAYFVCTTNVDSQLEKAGFPREKIFAPQGNYGYFQCSTPCTQDIYSNKEIVEHMVANMVSATDIRTEDIPKCPKCGGNMVPNLRCDNRFVEAPHMWNAEGYENFINSNAGNKILLLELGVGYNTPGIIRFPFEQVAKRLPYAHLVRLNLTQPDIPYEIAGKGTSMQEDLGKILQDLRYSSHH